MLTAGIKFTSCTGTGSHTYTHNTSTALNTTEDWQLVVAKVLLTKVGGAAGMHFGGQQGHAGELRVHGLSSFGRGEEGDKIDLLLPCPVLLQHSEGCSNCATSFYGNHRKLTLYQP